MPSTLISFETKTLSLQFEGFDSDNEMQVIATSKITDHSINYYLTVNEARSLHKFLSDHLLLIESKTP